MLLIVHIVFGAIALGSGAVGLSARKGSRLHARAGSLFAIAMLVMALTGAAVAAFVPERGTAVIGIFTAYLVATSWNTARRRDGRTGRFELAGLAVAVFCAVTFLAFSLVAAGNPNGQLDSLPASAHYPFAALAILAAALDLNYILRREASARQRLGRHLWRMCAAFLIAAFSFFIGQQDEMPAAMRGAWALFVPELLILGAMLYWLVRLRFPKGIGAALARAEERRALARVAAKSG